MIRVGAGRTVSVREHAELLEQLQEELAALKPEEREVLELILAEQALDAEGRLPAEQPRLLRAVENIEWKTPPVDMRTFVYDEYFLGKTCSELYEVHAKALCELFDNGGYYEAIFTGAIGCLRGDTPVHDPVAGDCATVETRFRVGRPFHVWALSPQGPVIAPAWAPQKYPEAPMLRVVLETGEACVVTPHHRFWTGGSWATAAEVRERLRGSSPVLLASSADTYFSARERGVPHSSRTAPDSRAGCPRALHSDGERPLVGSAVGRGVFPSRAGAPAHSRDCPRQGESDSRGERSRICPASSLPSRLHSSLLAAPGGAGLLRALELLRQHGFGWSSAAALLRGDSDLPRTAAGPLSFDRGSSECPGCTVGLGPTASSSWGAGYYNGGVCTSTDGLVRVMRVEECPPEPYFDFHVPQFNSYRACGLWHHNTGKSFTASIGMCRVLYEISCMVNPHGAYHIAAHTPIHLVCLSVTEDLAVKVAFDYIIEKLQQSPYFQEKFPFKPGKKEFRFPNKISLAARATTDTSALGLNVISVFLDESDFIKKPGKARRAAGELDTAAKIYTKLKRRIKSRFQRGGRLPGMMFVVSSKGRTDDFSARHIMASRNDPTVFVQDQALWDVKRESYSAETFKVFVGNDSLPSRILAPSEEPEYERVAAANDNTVVISVPEDFRTDFEANLEDSIRDLAGIATVSIAPFIQRRERIQAAADYGEKNGLSHAFLRNGEPLYEYVPGLGGDFDWERMVEPARRPLPSGGYEDYFRPRLHPGFRRHAHIDPSLTGDSTGLAVGHVAGYKEVMRRGADRKEYAERAPVIVVDLLLRIVPPLGDEIILGDVRDLVYQMSGHGYQIGFVTMDSYQSADGLQQFRAKGYKAEVLSVDRKPDAYECLKTALYEGRLIFYGHPKLLEELRKVEKNHQTGKVDHPPGGCFVGETRIPLLDGTFPTIAELVGREVWVCSARPDGRLVPGRARGRLTKYTSCLVDVVLDSGAVLRCTPEHPWMLRDGSYKAAALLRPGVDRLMPVGRTWPVNGGYERLTDLEGRRILTHHMVYEHFYGPIPTDHVVHHINHDKTDNRPENLEAVTREEHGRGHTAYRHATDRTWVARLREGGKAFNESLLGRASHAEAMRKTVASLTHEQRKARAASHPAFRRDIDLPRLTAVRSDPEAVTANAAARILGCGRNVVQRVLQDHGYDSWGAFRQAEQGLNHKVRAVIPVNLADPVPVYDLEVDEWSNFALAAGVVVHNSKDIADALAAIVYTLTETPQATSEPLPLLRGLSYTPEPEIPMARPPTIEGPTPAAEPLSSAVRHQPLPLLRGDDDPGFDPETYEP